MTDKGSFATEPVHLVRYRFEKYVLEVAIATLENGGVASKLDTYQLLPPTDTWSFPKYPARTAILPPEVDLAEELKTCAREGREIVALYNSKRKQTVYL